MDLSFGEEERLQNLLVDLAIVLSIALVDCRRSEMDVLEVGSSQFSLSLLRLLPDQEKVVNHPQAENSNVNIVLKIARIATKDEQKYVYQILVWHDEILKS